MTERYDDPVVALWRRLDTPGHEACLVDHYFEGRELEGTAVFAHEGRTCQILYTIHCDDAWATRAARVRGRVGHERVKVLVQWTDDGRWELNGNTVDAVAGCVDIDLNFSPATNMLPIRRLDLAVGESASVRAAWLRFPSFTLEPLEQTYTRLAERRYRYESAGGSFVAELTVDDAGLVVDYGEIWAREALGEER